MLERLGLAILAAVALVAASPVGATPYTFGYDFQNGESLSGNLEGDLQADGTTILVTSLGTVVYTGLPGTAFHTDLDAGANVVTLSGVGVLFATVQPSGSLAGFAFDAPFGLAAVISFAAGPPSFLFEPYEPQRWSIAQTRVPEPGMLAILGLGLTGVAVARRRRPAA